jgi:hypothetical protein
MLIFLRLFVWLHTGSMNGLRFSACSCLEMIVQICTTWMAGGLLEFR